MERRNDSGIRENFGVSGAATVFRSGKKKFFTASILDLKNLVSLVRVDNYCYSRNNYLLFVKHIVTGYPLSFLSLKHLLAFF